MQTLTAKEIQFLNSASSFEQLADIALEYLIRVRSSHSEIILICGPMSTGGCGDFQKNMDRFNRSIEVALSRGVMVFNQVLFQEVMIRICDWKEGEPYPMDILEIFYARVLSSGHITKALFLRGWESSLGARWEREFVLALGIPAEEYPDEWIDEIS